MDIKDAFEIITSNMNDGLHLNIQSENHEIIAQIFNVADFNKWNLGIQFDYLSGAVLELNFSKSKTNNHENFSRFINSVYWLEFEKPKQMKENSFFKVIAQGESIETGIEEISSIIEDVYGKNMTMNFELVNYK